MSRRSTKTSACVACDYPGCPSVFTTYSFAAFARKQAAAAGWTRRRGRSIAHPEDAGLVVSDRTVDICPEHGELPKPERIRKAG